MQISITSTYGVVQSSQFIFFKAADSTRYKNACWLEVLCPKIAPSPCPQGLVWDDRTWHASRATELRLLFPHYPRYDMGHWTFSRRYIPSRPDDHLHCCLTSHENCCFLVLSQPLMRGVLDQLILFFYLYTLESIFKNYGLVSLSGHFMKILNPISLFICAIHLWVDLKACK
jgi:hypothetical protein